MSLIKGNHAGLGGAGAPGGALGSFYSHTIDQSLRFNDDDDPRLTRTWGCLLYTSPSPRDGLLSRMPSSA